MKNNVLTNNYRNALLREAATQQLGQHFIGMKRNPVFFAAMERRLLA